MRSKEKVGLGIIVIEGEVLNREPGGCKLVV
jgi:hypothetical protein